MTADAGHNPNTVGQQGREEAKSRLDPTALAVSDLAALLTKAGGVRVEVAWIEADLAAGAPANADGTVNLMHYTAWLAKAMATAGTGGTALGG